MKPHSFKRALVGLVFMLAAVPAFAQEHPAQALVVEATTSLINVLDSEADRLKNDPAFLDQQVEKHIVPFLDFSTMTKLAVGKYWRKADESQRGELVVEFKKLLLKQYTSALTEYSGETIDFQPFRAEKRPDRAVVRSVFNQSGGDDVPVLYKLRTRKGETEWKIYDIDVNNVSLVNSFRTAFASEINRGGIDGLLNTMKEKNAKS